MRRYPARSVVFFEGDDAHEVLLINSGQVKVTVTSLQGREVVLDVLGPGELLGELSAIDRAPRSAGAATLGPVDLVAIEVGRFNQFVDEDHAVAVALLRSVAGRLRYTTPRQVEFGTVDGIARPQVDRGKVPSYWAPPVSVMPRSACGIRGRLSPMLWDALTNAS